MPKIGANVISGAALAALGLTAFVLSFRIGITQWGAESARMFPQIVAAGLLLLSARLAFLAAPEEDDSLPAGPELAQIAQLFVLGVCYIFLIDKFGFLIATFFPTPVVFWLFGLRRPMGLLIATILTPVLLHIIFFELLGLFPPFGEWFDLLDILQGG